MIVQTTEIIIFPVDSGFGRLKGGGSGSAEFWIRGRACGGPVRIQVFASLIPAAVPAPFNFSPLR
jgi:hypothetical protein